MLGVVSEHASILNTPEQVSALAERIREEGRMALDVEFLWERTYAPIPCLAQVATSDEIALIDPIEGAPLDAYFLLEDKVAAAQLSTATANMYLAEDRILGFEIVASTPEQFTAYQAAEFARWKRLIESRNIKAD